MKRFDILTLFPGMFEGFTTESILGRAQGEGLISIVVTNIRDFASGRHKITDDYSFGGGCGMVMMAEPIMRALESVSTATKPENKSRIVLMSPQGRGFCQEDAIRLASYDQVIFICGHYEGVDERISSVVDEEISIGDFVLTGGEIAAMAVVDATARMIPGVLGHEDSAGSDSFFEGLLDYPHYTRPRVWRGIPVPEVLLSGDHEAIRLYRRSQALKRTAARRPDLLEGMELTEEDERLLYDLPKKKRRSSRKSPAVKDDY